MDEIEAGSPALNGADEAGPADAGRRVVPLLTLVAVVEGDEMLGIDIGWANGVTDPAFAARILDELRMQVSSVQRSAEWLARLLPDGFGAS